ncbi:MAG TPA: hypothetical protein VGC81_03105, partial [Candidatus Methylomirabilis sp.]
PVPEAVLGVGVSLICPRCWGRRRILGPVTDPSVVRPPWGWPPSRRRARTASSPSARPIVTPLLGHGLRT